MDDRKVGLRDQGKPSCVLLKASAMADHGIIYCFVPKAVNSCEMDEQVVLSHAFTIGFALGAIKARRTEPSSLARLFAKQ